MTNASGDLKVSIELRQYLQAKKWRYRPAGNGSDLAIQTCPFCGKAKWKFWFHPTRNIYRCWHCDAAGNLYKLKREMGDLGDKVASAAQASGMNGKEAKEVPMEKVLKWHKNLLKSADARSYCSERGFNQAAIEHFKLGIQKKRGIWWLAIPHIIDGKCYNVKFRSLPPEEKKFRRVAGSKSVLFNADCLGEFDWVVLVESETDAISFWTAGITNVVSLTAGAGTFLSEWYDMLSDKERVVLALDADPVGQAGARDVARRIGFDKCENILLPLHDANEVLTNLGPQALVSSVETGELFEVEGALHIGEVLLQCLQAREIGEEGLLTPWDQVNQILGNGLSYGDLLILSAKYKTGKTSFALNWADYISHNLGIPTCFYCLEMHPRRLANKLVAHKRKKLITELGSVDYNSLRWAMRRTPLYIIEPGWTDNVSVDDVFDKIREVVKRHGIRFLVFDHLHFLCRSLQFITTEVGQVTRRFKMLAEELEIAICLIAQPKKIGDKIMTADDLKDSSAIPTDADLVLLLHRNKIPAGGLMESGIDSESDQEVMEAKTLVRVDATRFGGGGECNLHFDGATSTYYNWADRPARII